MSDLISRQKILATLDNADKFLDEERTVEKYKELLTECIKVLPSDENKGDLISRQAVMDELEKWDWQDLYLPIHFKQILDDVPSVENNGEWIPVSERLPEKFRFVNCTCHSLIDDREDWVVETVYVPQPPNSPYSDWGNIPMLNDKECEVTAWVYREIPEPYKAESEESGYNKLMTISQQLAFKNEELRENIEKAKAKIVALPKTYPFINHIDTYVKEDDVLQILDSIGKADMRGKAE